MLDAGTHEAETIYTRLKRVRIEKNKISAS